MKKAAGYTINEVLILVAIIGIIAAVVVPNFIRSKAAARQNTCISNLQQIQSAVQIWAIDNGAADIATPTRDQLVPSYIKIWPNCMKKEYSVPAVNAEPECPNGTEGHVL